ncbi:MAG: DUF433 domain-containing protein [Rhodomicrobium sp.]
MAERIAAIWYPGKPGYEATKEFHRITQNRAVMGGKFCIRGMRVTVGMIVGQIGAGERQSTPCSPTVDS